MLSLNYVRTPLDEHFNSIITKIMIVFSNFDKEEIKKTLFLFEHFVH